MVEEEFNESMRVEWAKTRARKARWTEELLILEEEMQWVISFQKWKAAWWREQALVRKEADATILSGVAGYANKQAGICERLAAKCALHWMPQLKAKGVIPGWAAVKYWNRVGRKNRTEERKNGRAENGTEEGRRERSDEVTGESGGILKGRKMLRGWRTVKENNQRTEDRRTESRRTENQGTRIQKDGRTWLQRMCCALAVERSP